MLATLWAGSHVPLEGSKAFLSPLWSIDIISLYLCLERLSLKGFLIQTEFMKNRLLYLSLNLQLDITFPQDSSRNEKGLLYIYFHLS